MSDDFALPDLTNANINTKQVYDPLPPAKYNLMVTEAKFKKSKSGKNFGVGLTLVVTDGEYTKRKLWHDFWLKGSDAEKSATMAGMLASFLAIANVRINGDRIHNRNLSELNKQEFLAAILGSKVIGRVAIEQNDPQYAPKNVIKGFAVHPSNPEPPTSTTPAEPQTEVTSAPSAGPDEAPDLAI